MSSSVDEFPALKNVNIWDHKAEGRAQAEADAKVMIDAIVNPASKHTPKNDDDDFAEIFDFTQRESERAERFMKTTDRIAKMTQGGKPGDKVRATAYLEAALSAVENNKKCAKRIG